jgi:hypothetical protein
VRLESLPTDQLVISPDLSRSRSAKQFEDRLKASIEEIGLAEPIKVAPLPDGKYLVVDGALRLSAIAAIRNDDRDAFACVPAYIVDYERRFELRYQTDIYQDLLPSQLAVLVEHLHKSAQIRKSDIAKYMGVSPPTLRNYTGLWRLLQRGGLFARIVALMDARIFPASNPYAWLRLTAKGIRFVIEERFGNGEKAETWITRQLALDRGATTTFPIKFVEAATGTLPPACYREDANIRSLKRNLGMRRANQLSLDMAVNQQAIRNLSRVARCSSDPVLRSAARSLRLYLQ